MTSSRYVNEWIEEALWFNEYRKLPSSSFIPRWAIACIRQEILTKGFQKTDDRWYVVSYVRNILLRDSEVLKSLKTAQNQNPYYSAVFRDNSLHLFKQAQVRDRDGDIVIEDEDIETFMSHLIHADWRLDIESWMKRELSESDLNKCLNHSEQTFLFKLESMYGLPADFGFKTYYE